MSGKRTGVVYYLWGANPENWSTGGPTFTEVQYPGLYPGVDLIFHENRGRLEYDLIVAAGASWRSIRIAASAEGIEIDHDGALRLKSGSNWLLHERPTIYQDVENGRRQVSGAYALLGNNEVGFEIGPHDPARPLIIDPTVTYASYLGGTGDDYGYAVATDAAGYVYVVGETASADYPLQGPEQSVMMGSTDVFVTKWDPTSGSTVYSTYLGGSGRDVALGVAVDAEGAVYITGFTYSPDLPITNGAMQGSFGGQSQAFVMKLSPAGNSLVYSTYLGGSRENRAAGIAVNSVGEAYITGYTNSVDFPATADAFQGVYGGGSYDGFFAKLNAAGSVLLYATYFGGSGNDTTAGITLDPSGNVYITGQTQSSDFPVVNPLQKLNGQSAAIVVKMNTAGQVVYASYLGGKGLNNGTGIAADATGNAYVTGFTSATDFPVKEGAFQTSNKGTYDGFIAILNPDGSEILHATYLGGSGTDISYGIALDSAGDIYIAGSTYSPDFPARFADQAVYGDEGDAFVAEFDSELSSLLYSTYFGGGGIDIAQGIAMDGSGEAYVAGWTGSGVSSQSLPTTAGAAHAMGAGGIDGMIAQISLGNDLSCATSVPRKLPVQAGSSAQLLGDLVLSCTGGRAGKEVSLNIQASLNADIVAAGRSEPVANSGTPPIQGLSNGSGSIAFQGISFVAPGPAGVVIWTITNVWADVAALAVGEQVVITLSASGLNCGVTVTPAFQGVAVIQNLVPARMEPVSGSELSSSRAKFKWDAVPGAAQYVLTIGSALGGTDIFSGTVVGTTAEIGFIPCSGGTIFARLSAEVGGIVQPLGDYSYRCNWAVGDLDRDGHQDLLWQESSSRRVKVDYYAGLSPVPQGSNSLNRTGVPGWRVVGAGDFDRNGVPDLVWQNDISRQIVVNYYGGVGGAVYQGWAYLNGAGVAGWSVVGVADINSDGVPDLIWQSDKTGQVVVNYYGGAGGALYQNWAYLDSAGVIGWKVVAVADFDGNRTPDLVWQNTTTGQVVVHYYGGTGGSVYQGWAYLDSAGMTGSAVAVAIDLNADGVPDLIRVNPATGSVVAHFYGGLAGTADKAQSRLSSITAGWIVVAMADFNGDGEPDLVVQNQSTRQVDVNYYSFGGAAYQSGAWINSSGIPGWTLVGTGDFDGNGVPDLVWQNDSTRQEVVQYYGGAGGVVYQGWAYLNAAGVPGWAVVAIADMNGDGVPDLIWQNTTTTQVVVNYYGGAGGAVCQGWAYLDPAGAPGWIVVAAADFDGNGTPDLIWQNRATTQVVLHYYGGPGGAVYQGWAQMDAVGLPGWVVVGAADFDGNGTPDLVWQHSTSAQVAIHYYGGPGGAVLKGQNQLNEGSPGWRAIVPVSR